MKNDIVCPLCQGPLEPDNEKIVCTDCKTGYHAECWEENQGCAIYGCPQVPPTEKRQDIEIPVSYWGKEQKPCPSCGQEILATALRCRHCGAIFSSIRPESKDEYSQHERLKQQLPDLRKRAVWFFIFNVLTFSAPLAAVAGYFWYTSHREDIKSLPPLYSMLFSIGLTVGIVQTIIIIFMGILFAIFRG